MSSAITTRTASIFLRDDGITQVTVAPKVVQAIEDAKENLAAAIEVGQGRKRPLLIDIRKAEPLDPESRHYYSGKKLQQSFLAMALLVEHSPLGIMMGNVYFRVAKPGVPIRLFVDESKVQKWLVQYAKSGQ